MYLYVVTDIYTVYLHMYVCGAGYWSILLSRVYGDIYLIMKSCIPAFVCILGIVVFGDTDVVIQTKLGKIKGLQTDTNLKFIGVPYAEPPLGKLR